MTQSASQIIVPGGAVVSVAAYGETLPTSEADTLNSNWNDIGYIDTGGVSFTPAVQVLTVEADQSPYPVLSRIIAVGASIAFNALQWNEDTLLLAFGGGTITEVTSGHFKYSPPAVGEPYEVSVVYDYEDGDYTYRLVLARCAVASISGVALASRSNSPLAIALSALAPTTGDVFSYFSDNPAWRYLSQS